MSSEEQTKTNSSEIMITIESMHKWFGDFHVLKNINLFVDVMELLMAIAVRLLTGME